MPEQITVEPIKRGLFLVTGQMQTGKDTFGALLASAVGGQTASLADPIKTIAINMLGMPRSVAYGSQEARLAWTRYGKNAREWLQQIGSEHSRALVHDDVWLHRFMERVGRGACKNFVLTDARFRNELECLTNPSWWALNNPYHPQEIVFDPCVKIRIKRTGSENADPHPSEAEQLTIPDSFFDHVIVNDAQGTAVLESAAKSIARECGIKPHWAI